MSDATQTLTVALPERLLLPQLRLTVSGGRAPTSTRVLEQRMLYVGSAPDNDVVIADPSVSRNHLRVEGERGGYRLRDLESKNGTWLGHCRLQDALLTGAATLRLGQVELTFEPLAETHEVTLAREARFGDMIGASPAMREIFAQLARLAPTDVAVLIEGESGTGKELVAEALHRYSRRAAGPFVVFDCSAVQPNLVESELFGHVRGAFTGAAGARHGALTSADGGTIFLDEVGELTLDLQPKLLRALENHEIRPVGSNERRRVDVRVVAATNRDLRQAVREGTFREDLYWRLNVVQVRLPPLRRRREDIPLLVQHFLEQASQREGGSRPHTVGYPTMQRLQAHPWPGNVRELRNAIERAAALSSERELEVDVQPALLHPAADAGAEGALEARFDLPFKDAKQRLIDAFERIYWERAMAAQQWNVSAAARAAGLHRKSLEYVLRKLGIERPEG
jgi:DNA-binding NtrC family response regulator